MNAVTRSEGILFAHCGSESSIRSVKTRRSAVAKCTAYVKRSMLASCSLERNSNDVAVLGECMQTEHTPTFCEMLVARTRAIKMIMSLITPS